MEYNPKPFNQGYLPEEDGHQVFYAEYGNKNGETIVNCHGGPGSKSKPIYTSSFDLSKYHVVIFDQRGCGKSLPQGEIKNNTTADLISDMERLRTTLKVKKWYVSGSSWGSTISLLYAESHPDKVKGLLISSIFLARETDIAWSFTSNDGTQRLFSDVWEQRSKFLKKYNTMPADAAKDLLKQLIDGTDDIQKEITAGVMNWEGNLMSAQQDVSYTDPVDVEINDINEVKIFLHYESNNSFIKDNQIITNIEKIKNIPAIIVHGRYDVLCALDQMWELTKSLNNAEYIILPSSNHKLTADGGIAKKYAYRYFLAKQENKYE